MIRLLARSIRRAKSGGDRDQGMAMILVLGWSMVLTLIVSTLLAYTVGSMTRSRREQDYNAALAAAQAGVDDFLSRLNANNTYWQSTDCTNTALKRAFTTPVPCGWGTGTAVGWQPIAGAKSPNGQACTVTPLPPGCGVFHYDMDASQTMASGNITLTSTGHAAKLSRSVSVVIRRQGFADFLYYSDIETIDPAYVPVYGVNNSTALTSCARHYWENPSRNNPVPPVSSCPDINFISADTLTGPVHSNDAIVILGSPTFNGPVSTAYPNCAPNAQGTPPPSSSCYRDGGGAAPNFAKGLSYASQIQLPPTNAALKAQAVTATAQGTAGCMFTGPTRIQFNSAGTMTVWSPYSLTTNPGCGAPSPNGATIAVPNNNVIFVQNVPSGQVTPAVGNCAAGAIGGYPQTGDINFTYGEYNCRVGTAFVSGTLAGRATLGADASIIVVDDLVYAGGNNGGDALGLVANNNIYYYHPVSCTTIDGFGRCTAGNNMNRPNGTPFNNPTVQAAMLSLNHFVGFMLHNVGTPTGTLNIYGAISQKYRGAVGSTSSGSIIHGYAKNYNYDKRLKYAPPPYYLDPVQSAYGPATFAEVHAAY